MYSFNVTDMTCGGCAATITDAIKCTDPAAQVQADPTTKRVEVESTMPASDIAAAIAAAGYHVAQ
jgi:copper chaperone